MTYQAPVDDILAALKSAGALDPAVMNGAADPLDEATIRANLEQAGHFGAGVLDPLNRAGDRIGARPENGRVVTPPGWAEAYLQFAGAGWNALPCPVAYGGQGLPSTVAMGVCEIWNAASMAFGLCPLLTSAAIDLLHIGGSEELKARCLPRMAGARSVLDGDLAGAA